MLNEHLTQLWANVHSTEHSSVCLTKSSFIKRSESVLIKNSFFVWCAIVSEKASATLDESSFSSFRGRMLIASSAILRNPDGFASFLELLDEVDDVILKTISSVSSSFKGKMLISELRRVLSGWSIDLWRLLSPLITVLLRDFCWETVAFLRQMSSLLSKLGIDRSDLLESHYSSYLKEERVISETSSYQAQRDPIYWHALLNMRTILQPIVDSFCFQPNLCKHGPGSVSLPAVKTKVDKYRHFGLDRRVDYVLRKGGFGEVGDYSPFPLIDESRTSRVIFVPKTWKKLRGISAEPVELQFFQQGIFGSLQDAVDNSYLSQVIDLKSQEKSRHLALKGSRDGSLATIDLSSASDSVTLQLIKDLFGTSSLCRWLVATRSKYTVLNGLNIEISKFAPMGSACCFPVECLVFASIILSSVTAGYGLPDLRDYQVFGDDLICPSVHAPRIIEVLQIMGFTVNYSKTFYSGDFRESCGMDAWCGFDVTPLKLREFSYDFNGSMPPSYEDHSRTVSYLNSLYVRGFVRTRSFLLRKFLECPIHLQKGGSTISQSLVFGHGESGSVYTAHNPTNYRLKRINTPLFRSCFRMITWKPRKRKLGDQMKSDSEVVRYFEYLLKHSRDEPSVASYGLNWFRRALSESSQDTDRGVQMIPVWSLVDPWYRL